MDMTNLSLDAINMAIDYAHESEDIERDANAMWDEVDADDRKAAEDKRLAWEEANLEQTLQEARALEAQREAEFENEVIDGFRVGDMRAAFSKVADPTNWKLPIQAGCRTHEKDLTSRAIEFMVGSKARFTHLHGDVWLVEAD